MRRARWHHGVSPCHQEKQQSVAAARAGPEALPPHRECERPFECATGAIAEELAERDTQFTAAGRGRGQAAETLIRSVRAAELPVRHQTLRAGSPYTLILTKTDALFERERKARQRAITDLAWLTENWPAAG